MILPLFPYTRSRRWILSLGLLTSITTCPVIATAGTIIGPGHMDFDFNVTASGTWSTSLSHDTQGEFATDINSVLYMSSLEAPEGNRFSRPPGPSWDFLGVGAGEDVWLISQVQDDTPNSVWVGLNTEATSSSYLQSWDPAPAAVGSGKWLELRLLGVDYHGEGTSNHMSMFLSDAFGNPILWMDTADGIATDDSYFMIPGGHSHMNWAFTSEGIYDVTFQARTYLSGGVESISDPFTVRFGVNATDSVPEPERLLLLLAGLGAIGARRGRPSRESTGSRFKIAT